MSRANQGKTTGTKPFILVDDLKPQLLHEIDKLNSIDALNPNIFESVTDRIRNSLEKIFENVIVIDSDSVRNFENKAINNEGTQLVSIASTFTKVKSHINCTRSYKIDASKGDIDFVGVCHRFKNLNDLNKEMTLLKDTAEGESIALIDDVIYSGQSLLEICNLLREHEIKVKKIHSLVAKNGAVEMLNSSLNVEVVSEYLYTEVIDIVSARDFIFGFPYGGKNIISNDNVLKFSTYIYPLGLPCEWANIPKELVVGFSKEMLKLSYDFWSEIETVLCSEYTLWDLPKLPAIWPPKTKYISKGLRCLIDDVL
ncbi:TPA: phosphoribosyltransferase [Vibrio vulnificus]|nr:phosphoribosyltransferase [Vibrio vulnificus]HDY7721497.1 phosphoribosyltransferase [Vibrio vulnificus]HDY7748743.1 phosphoribosyltransferase [Vibrio vulnificus]HDY7756551.1 phosphoribosyltransferase [Vibrio vulnificus]HDY7760968.1 phosphoribosyltransferase [Vibrio vulnificus]